MNNIHTQKIDKLEKENKVLLDDIGSISKKYREAITKLKEEIKVLKEKIEVQNRVVYEYMNQFGITDYIEKAGDNWRGPMEEEDFAAVKANLCNGKTHNGGKRNTKRKKKK